jgi:hypothetical protein
VGHIHLNSLPDTAPWQQVVELIADGADVPAVAESATAAATDGLDRARRDPGVSDSLYLLTKVALAAREADFAEGLRSAGIRVGDSPDVMELVSGFSEAADRHLRVAGRTDLGEMARLSAAEALTGLLSQRSTNLFETTPAEVRRAAPSLSTQVGFATLAHEFYTCFTRRFLTYHHRIKPDFLPRRLYHWLETLFLDYGRAHPDRPKIHSHQLRKRAFTAAWQNNVDPRKAAIAYGCNVETVMKRYVNLDEQAATDEATKQLAGTLALAKGTAVGRQAAEQN